MRTTDPTRAPWGLPWRAAWAHAWRDAWPAATVMGALLLATASRYGPHGDELYFRMLPLAWWYDDQPPLTVWLSRAAAAVSDELWVQRLPAVAAAVAGVAGASALAGVAGGGPAARRAAAWAHAGGVYPLLVGHVFLTSSIDLLVWQVLAWCVLQAVAGHPRALLWAGVTVGLGCWDKLLVVVPAAALVVAVACHDRRLLASRWALLGALAATALGGVQLAAQVRAGMPMSQVSADLVAAHGADVRRQVLPMLVVLVGPPLVGVWWRGLRWRPPAAAPGAGRGVPVLATTVLLVLGWTLVVPGQVYYPVGALLPALAAGWPQAQRAATFTWRHRRAVLAANGVVAVVLCLPVLPLGSPAARAVGAVVPVQRDQLGWEQDVAQVAAARGGRDLTVVVDSYALAGALAWYGPAAGVPAGQVFSGHNALWSLGPPTGPAGGGVLLVGRRAVALRHLLGPCEDAGTLTPPVPDSYGLAGSPMARCAGPRDGWAAVWPAFRHLGA